MSPRPLDTLVQQERYATQEKEAAVSHDAVNELIRRRYPHGHPAFLPITLRELQLHSDKNHDYAAGGSPLGNFDRVAAIFSNYPNLRLSDRRVVALAYAMKQLDAVLWGMNSNIVHKVEGLNDRLQDISVYSKIVMCMNEEDGQRAANQVMQQGTAAGPFIPLKVPVGPRETGLHAVVEYDNDQEPRPYNAKEDPRGAGPLPGWLDAPHDPRRI